MVGYHIKGFLLIKRQGSTLSISVSMQEAKIHGSYIIAFLGIISFLLLTTALFFQPMELLYRPLIDIQEELIPRDLPMSTIYSVYEETERERQSTANLSIVITNFC